MICKVPLYSLNIENKSLVFYKTHQLFLERSEEEEEETDEEMDDNDNDDDVNVNVDEDDEDLPDSSTLHKMSSLSAENATGGVTQNAAAETRHKKPLSIFSVSSLLSDDKQQQQHQQQVSML